MSIEANTTPPAEQNNVNYPWLLFTLADNHFAINTRYVNGIMICPKDLTCLPDSPPYVRGLFMLRDNIVRLLDLRMLFGLETLRDECEGFCDVLEQHKQDAVNWVKELERCVAADEPFSLAIDPNKCAFGKWYANYKSDNVLITQHLRKMQEPHRRLHEMAPKIARCTLLNEQPEPHNIDEHMNELLTVWEPRIVSLMEEVKDIYRESSREMAIIIENGDRRLGLIVDQVLSVEEISRTDLDDSGVNFFQSLIYIAGVSQSRSVEGNILVVDDAKLLELTSGDGSLEDMSGLDLENITEI
ncbi:MAG: hypothetical protein HFG19_06820 [Oscillospiraceae bacterium]|nr:hypothetical protein [Oscillospiraceae bacterium]